MAKCLNCSADSTFVVENTGALAQDFCDKHLPKFYNINNLPYNVTPVKKAEPVVETPKPAKKKAVAEPVVEAVVEPVVEEPVEEKPAEE